MPRDGDQTTLFDFGAPGEPGEWFVINDTVMGGRSSSSVEVAEGILVFSGELSLENGGGFCSARSKSPGRDLSDYAGLAVRIRTGDRSFTLTAHDREGRDIIGYHHPLPVTGDEWGTVHALFADFEAHYHGRIVEDDPGLNTAHVRSVGFLIAEQQQGPFRLEVAWIRAFGAG